MLKWRLCEDELEPKFVVTNVRDFVGFLPRDAAMLVLGVGES